MNFAVRVATQLTVQASTRTKGICFPAIVVKSVSVCLELRVVFPCSRPVRWFDLTLADLTPLFHYCPLRQGCKVMATPAAEIRIKGDANPRLRVKSKSSKNILIDSISLIISSEIYKHLKIYFYS